MRTKPWLILVILLFSLDLYSNSGRLALVIGNNEYEHAGKLQNPVNDARDIAAQLKLLGFEVIERYDAEMRDMMRSVDEFGRRLQDFEVGLFYYSGHGIQFRGDNFLIPVDANLQTETDAEYDCLNTGRVLSRMEGSGIKTSIIILDACRNNPFENSWERSLSNNGLAFMEAPTGSLIAYSTAPGKTASDGSGSNGLYTKHLLNYIGDPEYNILQVFQEVRKRVREESADGQTPWESTSLEDDFFFNQTGYRVSIREEESAGKDAPAKSRKISEEFDEIRTNASFLWTEATGDDVEAADQSAKTELTVKIMQELYKRTGYDKMTDGKQEAVRMITSDLLLLTERRIAAERRKIYSLRYLPLHTIDASLKLNDTKAREYFDAAESALLKLRVADAVRNFFWSHALAAVHPGQIGIEKNGRNQLLQDLAAHKLSQILKNTRVEVVDSSSFNDRKIYTFKFSYFDRKVQNVDFSYWNGESWSAVVCANNGSAMASMFPGYGMQDLKIRLEYAGDSESKFDPFLLQAVNSSALDGDNMISISVKTGIYLKHHEISERHLAVINEVLDKVKQEDDTFDPSLFTREGFEVYKKLLIYGNAQFLSIGNAYTSFDLYGHTYVRSVPFTFSFRNNKVHFTEDLCFELDSSGLLSNITFALGSRAIKDVMKMTRWPMESKLQIIHFLENYKTAYALERDDYIEKIFSDNALIIVGKKLEVSKQPDQGNYYLTGDNFEFTQLTKEEYLYRLRRVFKWNEYINIQFEDNVVKKRDNQSEVYGINIKQNYFSSTYADQGYLFLMVDVQDPGQPMIYVRSWQPEKFADGRVISLSDFSY